MSCVKIFSGASEDVIWVENLFKTDQGYQWNS
eukprot:UN08960